MMDAEFSMSYGTLAGSTRTTRLLRLTDQAHGQKAPLVLISDLTDVGRSDILIRVRQVASLLTLRERPLYLVHWARPWREGGGERFSPLVRDLDALIRSVLPNAGAMHIATFGSGALIGFKWLAHCTREGNPVPVCSLSLLAPSLSVMGRAPRTSLASAPARSCVVTDMAGRAADWAETISLAARLPHPPEFIALDNPEHYLVARDTRTLTDTGPGEFIEFAGSWKQAWCDWLSAAEPDTARLAS
ncbi:hypothetical protein [Shimia aestuarii]|uniref:Alpha/beta hydrolase family protein n=1 Tax=Shimia aestuarii TaxID=254406 RepID=A0A1I4T1C2_9RHOB|nr:hypothetical protein [Shimia aestuarii]SFM70435.1 hypothetical protein SAMN04488042_11318 [Shimia aestuarii]